MRYPETDSINMRRQVARFTPDHIKRSFSMDIAYETLIDKWISDWRELMNIKHADVNGVEIEISRDENPVKRIVTVSAKVVRK